MYSIFVVLCLVNTAFAWTRSFGFCPFLDTEPDFDISKVNLNGKLILAHKEINIMRLYLEFLTFEEKLTNKNSDICQGGD